MSLPLLIHNNWTNVLLQLLRLCKALRNSVPIIASKHYLCFFVCSICHKQHYDEFDDSTETLGMCRNIHDTVTLLEALRGFRQHRLSYLVIDRSEMPPFPNNMLYKIQVDWMEVINSPVQFHREYLQCTIKCTLS